MTQQLRVLSIYEGFFSGGARMLHSDAVIGLHQSGQRHSVLSIHREIRREATRQAMENDPCYRSLIAAGVPVESLGRHPRSTEAPRSFSTAELATASRLAASADVVLSLKEQPLRLINQLALPRRPVVVCLHRSDPENQGGALHDLRAAVDRELIAACICCAESTRAAYQAAGIPAELLHVIPNGVDLMRFRPDPAKRVRQRQSMGVPMGATVVVFAARYDGMKNVPLFLRAARACLARDPTGHILMCGAGMTPANADLCTEIAAVFGDRPSLTQRLHLLAVRGDMEAVYAAADVVALTSSTGEAAPLCLIEGMMCGAVPVATDIGDCSAIVDGHGILTPPDPGVIADAWAEAAARRAEFSPALLRSRERYSRTRMIAAYAALIDRVHRDRAVAPVRDLL